MALHGAGADSAAAEAEMDARQLGVVDAVAGAERPRRSRATSGAGDWTPVLSAASSGP
ncbi:hypothetical protein [Sorangium sp. So ce388]|uniref:hypothetical protein n=1 Tax=Sorangium sp. So ce388 TaxID=3133309 RepID=UPI003F5B3604